MKKLISLCAVMPLVVCAQQYDWKLQLDSDLNGELTDAPITTHKMAIETYAHIISGKFSTLATPHTLNGQLEAIQLTQIGSGSTQRIQFIVAEAEKRTYFLGQGTLSNGFKGAWFGANNDSGDFNLITAAQQPSTPLHCAEVLNQDPSAQSGIYSIDPDGGSAENAFNAYCDMTTDEGGWTLIGTFSKSQAGGYPHINQYDSFPDTTLSDPSHTGLYQGTLSHFTDVREQVACTSGGCQSAYQVSATTSELEMIRYTWGYIDQQEKQQQGFALPNCTDAYKSGASYNNCLYANDRNNTNVIGWQRDIHGAKHSCWLAHGVHKPNSLGS
ncbi:fibrinogen-like YCDxxxxGGGW domain-containing protein [Pseudoalteromonas sp. MMG012]|uniref:fibrinogen-like YCDxxxxGGGW domain-containing protein n=1 Tax=Pseudoalteromonas sp. MMG012 TaxID=2822686 RepID=UPI001B3A0864|nr:fibrinogen-like YCDxxxxGGGW domain-containing protein [Pseudoalteromonas sp. MMG012]MBQ4851697.1 hypothetical protein [Pseudoalteromonas sp. MMG012]